MSTIHSSREARFLENIFKVDIKCDGEIST